MPLFMVGMFVYTLETIIVSDNTDGLHVILWGNFLDGSIISVVGGLLLIIAFERDKR